MTSSTKPLMTVADLEAFPDDDGNRYELIEGELFVSCAPGLTHQIISDNIIYLFRRYLEHNPVGIVVSTIGLILSEYSGVIPDIVFFKRESSGRIVSGERLTSAPELVIEILSAGSENIRRDRVAKFNLYGKYGVSEYWLIDKEKQSVEIYRFRDATLYLVGVFSCNDEISTPVVPGFSCLTSQVFIVPPLFNS